MNQRFIIVIRNRNDPYEQTAHGVYRSFKTADNDARAQDNWPRYAVVLPLNPTL